MTKCPDCIIGKLYDYYDNKSGFTESMCWLCGHYESNSPAYKSDPKAFENLVRGDPIHFMRKYAENRHQPTFDKEKNNRSFDSTHHDHVFKQLFSKFADCRISQNPVDIYNTCRFFREKIYF